MHKFQGYLPDTFIDLMHNNGLCGEYGKTLMPFHIQTASWLRKAYEGDLICVLPENHPWSAAVRQIIAIMRTKLPAQLKLQLHLSWIYRPTSLFQIM